MRHYKYDLSVIIPVYNAAQTLRKCVNSVVNPKCNMEVIIVDDESSDNTEKIVEELRIEYSNIKYYKKSNGGVASARNYGLRHVNGKYVTFIDQDDWIEKQTYEKVLEELNETDVDMYVFGYSKEYVDRRVPMENIKQIPHEIDKAEDVIKYAFYREMYRNFAAFVWNKVFRSDFLIKNGIFFDENLERGDDVLFITKVAIFNPLTLFCNEHFYHYCQRDDSITHTYTEDNYHRLKDILNGYEKAIDLIDYKVEFAESVDYMKCFYVYHASLLLEWIIQQDNEIEKLYLRECIKKYYKQYCSQNANYVERLERINNLLLG